MRGVFLGALLLPCLLLGACSQGHELAVPKGPVFALNAGHWIPTSQDLNPTGGTKP